MPRSSYLFNKHGYGLHIPNLPKPDYLILKKRAEEWNMSFVQIILLGLRAIEDIPQNEITKRIEQVMKDV